MLDLACGDGHYTRWLKRDKQAASAVGAGPAPEMIKLAVEQQGGPEPLGARYVCQDAAALTLSNTRSRPATSTWRSPRSC